MVVSTRPIGTVLFVFTSLILFLLGSQATLAVDDMWDSVFAYQKKMADYGNAEAQHKLGEMYEEGHGTEQDFDKALEWYQRAAAQGYAPASKKIDQVRLRKQRAIAEAKAAEERRRAEQTRLEREMAERKRAELERIAREEAMQQQVREAERKNISQENLAKQRDEENQRKAKDEALARERAEAAIKAMMAIPSAFAED